VSATITALTVPEAHALLHMVRELPGRPRNADVEGAIEALDYTLDTYRELDSSALSWEYVWPHLRDEVQALAKAAEEVEAAADDLIRALAGHDAASLISLAGITPGGDAGTQDADAGSAE
jgi:hypothetical protein